ncbi:MAG: SCO1664 family protein [Chloroflexi bacterium]|nr:SCO1664 family protein [Chloroflexota bacterium]
MEIDKSIQTEILEKGVLEVEGQFLFGSNYSFLVSLCHNGDEIKAIYKPRKGEMPLWDFPPESLADREVAAYIISEALGWDLVPPTVIRRKAAFGKGSLQVFIEHNPEENYFTFSDELHQRLQPTAVFDLVINNADRKGSHILLDENRKIRLIDHGLCFHMDPKLRTVIWDFAGQSIPIELLSDLETINLILGEDQPVFNSLKKHLKLSEIRAISRRIEMLLSHPVFPEPDPKRRPYPWPLV